MAHQQNIGDEIILFTDDTRVPAPHLIISSHGAYVSRPEIGKEEERGGWLRVPAGVRLFFYGPHHVALEDPTVEGLLSKTPYEIRTGGELVRNYRLSKFQGRHGSETETYATIKQGIENNRTFVRTQESTLSRLGLNLSVQMSDAQRIQAVETLRPTLSAAEQYELTMALGNRRHEKYDVLTIRNRHHDVRSTFSTLLGITLRTVLGAIPGAYDNIHCGFCRSRLVSLPFGKGYQAVDGTDWQRRPNGMRRP
jgi:hypothetical protein